MNAARQVFHILLKDVRGHALEIGLVLALNLVLVLTLTDRWVEVRVVTSREGPISAAMQVLVLLAWCALIARVVQGDGVAGKAPYWLTRPGSRTALLVSKLVFVFLFVHVPSFLGQLAIVLGSGVPLSIPQLLVNQAIFAAGVSLPLIALAALTTTFSRLVLGGIAVAAVEIYVFGEGVYRLSYFRTATALALLALIACAALICQYRWRSTLRVAAGSFAALSLLGLGLVTLEFTYSHLQRARAAVIRPPTIPPTIRLLDASRRSESIFFPPYVSLPLDAAITGDSIVRSDRIEVHSAAGREVDLVGFGAELRRSGERDLWLDLQLAPAVYDDLKDSLVSVRLVVGIETYATRNMEPIPLDGSSAIVGGRAQCGKAHPYMIICRSAFGRSNWQVDASNSEARLRWLPLRMVFVLDPIETRQLGTRNPFAGASIATVVRERVSYTRQDVTFENVRLSDWAPERSEAAE